MSERFSVDCPPVTADEAMSLMCHHLGLAAAYFEVIEEKEDSQEVIDTVELRMEKSNHISQPSQTAAKAWIEEMLAFYKATED